MINLNLNFDHNCLSLIVYWFNCLFSPGFVIYFVQLIIYHEILDFIIIFFFFNQIWISPGIAISILKLLINIFRICF